METRNKYWRNKLGLPIEMEINVVYQYSHLCRNVSAYDVEFS